MPRDKRYPKTNPRKEDIDEMAEEVFREMIENYGREGPKYLIRRDLNDQSERVSNLVDHMKAVVYSGEEAKGLDMNEETPIEKEMKQRQASNERRLAWYAHQEGQWLVDERDNDALNIYIYMLPVMRKEINRIFNKYKHKFLFKRYPAMPTEKTLGFTGATAGAIKQAMQVMYMWRYEMVTNPEEDEIYSLVGEDIQRAFSRVFGQDLASLEGQLTKTNGFTAIKNFYPKRYVNSPYFGFVMPYLSATFHRRNILLNINSEQAEAMNVEQLVYIRRETFFYFFKPTFDWDAHKEEWKPTYDRLVKTYQFNRNPLWDWLQDPDQDDNNMKLVALFLFNWGTTHNINLRELAYDMQSDLTQNDKRTIARGCQMLKSDTVFPLLLTIQVLMSEICRFRTLYLNTQQDFTLTESDKKKISIEQKKKVPEYQKTIKKLKSQNGRLKQEKETLAKENDTLTKKNFLLSEEVRKLTEEKQSLKQQIEDMQERHDGNQNEPHESLLVDQLIPVLWPKNRSEANQIRQMIEIAADREKIKYQFTFSQKFIKGLVKVTDFRRRREILLKMIERLETSEAEAVMNQLHDEIIWRSPEKNTRQFRVSHRPASQRILYRYGENGEMIFLKYKIHSQHDEIQ